jgi:hypothetical protein
MGGQVDRLGATPYTRNRDDPWWPPPTIHPHAGGGSREATHG